MNKIFNLLNRYKPSFRFVWLSSLPFFILFLIAFGEAIPYQSSLNSIVSNDVVGIITIIQTIVFFVSSFWYFINKKNIQYANTYLKVVTIFIPVAFLFIVTSDDSCTGFFCLLSDRDGMIILSVLVLFTYSFFQLLSSLVQRLSLKFLMIVPAVILTAVVCFAIGNIGDIMNFFGIQDGINDWYEKTYCTLQYEPIGKGTYYLCK